LTNPDSPVKMEFVCLSFDFPLSDTGHPSCKKLNVCLPVFIVKRNILLMQHYSNMWNTFVAKMMQTVPLDGVFTWFAMFSRPPCMCCV